MTSKQVDRLIKSGAPVTVRTACRQIAVFIFLRRNRRVAYTDDGGAYEFRYLEVVS